MDTFTSSRTARGKSMRPMLLAVAGSFALGAAAVGYFAWQSTSDVPVEAAGEPAAPASIAASPTGEASPEPTPSPTVIAPSVEQVEQMAEQQGGLDQRLAAAEQRLARLDLQAQSAAGNVARAEGLLITFAVRRSIDRGEELGFLADQLRLRFGDALPNAVSNVLAFSRDPVTLDRLAARLDGLSPQLQSRSDQTGFERFQEELSALFTVRRESAPSPQPRMRIERARLFLLSGRTEDAIEEVRRMPGASNAEGWIRDAERYAATQHALDLLETAAVLEPRRLRDGSGNRISQPSLAEQPGE